MTFEQRVILMLLKYRSEEDQPCPFGMLRQEGKCPYWTWTGDEYQGITPQEWREEILHAVDPGDPIPCETPVIECLLRTVSDIARKMTPEDEAKVLKELDLPELKL